jgi:DNA-directed RNA polymerase specialized sigma24 family protein
MQAAAASNVLGDDWQAAEALPQPAQRESIWLLDLHGCTPAETCEASAISEADQRGLLRRTRSRVRRALAQPIEA